MLLFLFMWQFLFNVSDAALSVLLQFMYQFLKVIHSLIRNDVTAAWMDKFPCTVTGLRKRVLQEEIKYSNYVVCPRCHSLYDKSDCILKTGTTLMSKTCLFIEFPNHPMASFRKQCGESLLYTVERMSNYSLSLTNSMCIRV